MLRDDLPTVRKVSLLKKRYEKERGGQKAFKKQKNCYVQIRHQWK